jgi:hypothetical protein
MLKPRVNVVCEKVILDQQQGGMASLIGLFTKFTVNVPADAPPIPENAAAPKEWTVYSSWEPDEIDVGKPIVQCTQVLYPNGAQYGETLKTPLQIELNKTAQAIVRINGFPVGQSGFYTVRTWIEEAGKTVAAPLDLKVEIEIIKASGGANTN